MGRPLQSSEKPCCTYSRQSQRKPPQPTSPQLHSRAAAPLTVCRPLQATPLCSRWTSYRHGWLHPCRRLLTVWESENSFSVMVTGGLGKAIW
ncbi:hypothetical protein AVEN_76555-1 [Araneus ventricosus]|uniref:Uncharacterized protein n=1 Tax=Araneus ventricosus TaxID=182803 RepID=A0A4Y2QUU4_ARAVE|nr:hypothetical protein AVEN_76555-1 [Araneus ventricosus]